MATKRPDRRAQRTRKLLQEALIALVLEKGYEGVTVQDIIDRAYVGRSTFYAHFLDKQQLFLSGFEQLRDSARGVAGPGIRGGELLGTAPRLLHTALLLCDGRAGEELQIRRDDARR